MRITEFLNSFLLPDSTMLIAVNGIGTVSEYSEKHFTKLNTGRGAYFCPSQYKPDSPTKEKQNVLGTRFLWADIDDTNSFRSVLKPTYLVQSGGGFHVYFELREPLYDIKLIEQYNKIIGKLCIGWDNSTWNANRLLRIPGGVNTKYDHKPVVTIVEENKGTILALNELKLFKSVPQKTIHKIITGDSRGYDTRSERDFAVILSLVKHGFSNSDIEHLFNTCQVGDKYLEHPSPAAYLAKSIDNARNTTLKAELVGITEENNVYCYHTTTKTIKLSNFKLQLLKLIKVIDSTETFIVINLIDTVDNVTELTIPGDTFNKSFKFDEQLYNPLWIWMGSDLHCKLLLEYMLTNHPYQAVIGTTKLGMQLINGSYGIIASNQILMSNNIADPTATNLTVVESPLSINLTFASINKANPFEQLHNLFSINHKGLIYCFFSWYMLAAMKPYLETLGYSFPILMLSGIKGAGKTTMVKLFNNLFGYPDLGIYDSNTTDFFSMRMLSHNTSIPTCFTEFRYGSSSQFVRQILLSYDKNSAGRGRKDRTVEIYTYTTPLILDGEGMVSDPAALERMIILCMYLDKHQKIPQKFELAFTGLNQDKLLHSTYALLTSMLTMVNDNTSIPTILNTAKKEVQGKYSQLPTRIKNNHILLYAGMLIVHSITGIESPKLGYLSYSLDNIITTNAMTIHNQVDLFMASTVNLVNLGKAEFKYWVDNTLENTILSFQFGTAYAQYVRNIGFTNKAELFGLSTLKRQLKGSSYFEGIAPIENILMYEVNIKKAFDYGLDIPSRLSSEIMITRM